MITRIKTRSAVSPGKVLSIPPGCRLLVWLAMALLASAPAVGQPQPPAVRLVIASTFPSSMVLIGEAAAKLPKLVAAVTGGEVVLDLNEPDSLVPAAQAVHAVSQGTIDAAWAGAGWFAGIDSAFNMFSSVPFGPGIGEYLAWMYAGGGLALARELFAKYNIHNIPCALIPPEASGWFRTEIRTVDDLKGLRMRFFGLGAKVVAKLGVEARQLAPSDIPAALQLGTIDATEFSLPAIDQKLGFQRYAKFYYFPGWHQQATFFDLYIHKAKWAALADRHKAAIELSCGELIRDTIAQGEAAQWRALKEMQADGVQIKRWSPEILAALEKAWNEVVGEERSRNPNFDRVWQSYAAFRRDYALWADHAYLR